MYDYYLEQKNRSNILNFVLNKNFNSLTEKVEERLDKIDHKVRESLDEGFRKTSQTFLNVMERLTQIDAAQQQIKDLSRSVVSLQDILTDKKIKIIIIMKFQCNGQQLRSATTCCIDIRSAGIQNRSITWKWIVCHD